MIACSYMLPYMCHAFNALDQSTIHAVHDVCSILHSRNTIHIIGLCNTFFILAYTDIATHYTTQSVYDICFTDIAWYPYLLLMYAAWCHAMKLKKKKKKKEIKERFHAIYQCIPSVCYYSIHVINSYYILDILSITDVCTTWYRSMIHVIVW